MTAVVTQSTDDFGGREGLMAKKHDGAEFMEWQRKLNQSDKLPRGK
jgi:hypothetical protein